jgi:hypothetical protein
MEARVVDTPSNKDRGEYRATWVLVTNNASFLAQPVVEAMARHIPRKPGLHAWTDDNSSLLAILQWRLRNQP